MRQKRSKAYRKQMLVYNHAFNFRAPYQVIVDHEIVEVAEYSKLDLVKYIRNTVQDEVKPMITQCCMQKLYETKNQNAIELAKSFERRRCGHKDKAIDPSKCIESVVNIKGKNKHRYVVVTQDLDLRRELRRVSGVPLIYMNRSVMVMEPLSSASEIREKEFEAAKLRGGLNDINAGKIHVEKTEQETKRKRKVKEPNPLSVKKKRVQVEEEEEKGRRKRRRRHKKGGEEGGSEPKENGDNDEKEEMEEKIYNEDIEENEDREEKIEKQVENDKREKAEEEAS